MMAQGTLRVGLGLAVLLGACGAPTMTVHSEHDPETSWESGRYRTYAWRPGPRRAEAPQVSAVAPIAVRTVDEVLAARGYRASPEMPDFLVAWDATVEGRRQVSTVDITPTPGITGGGLLREGPPLRQTITTAREFDEGMLILDIMDAQTGRHVWRGWAQAEVKPGVTRAEREARIREAVQWILQQFPPKR